MKTRITCRLQGGLGNQLFQILATIQHALYHQCEFFFIDLEQSGGGRPVYWKNVFKKIRNKHLLPKGQSFSRIQYFNEPGFTFHCIASPYIATEVQCLVGYFQSPKYFSPSLLNWLDFPTLPPQEAISVHFRYGDYESLQHVYVPLTKTAYYANAILWMRKQTNCKTWWLFFDTQYDTETKRAFRQSLFCDSEDQIYEKNMHSDWESLGKMAQCRYHIIANSTFSWWGAYLSDASKTAEAVAYPLDWFQPEEKKEIVDLIPIDAKWTGIQTVMISPR